MKIKLQDYSLISNEWIDERINELESKHKGFLTEMDVKFWLILELKKLKQQLIPSEKLAEVAWEDGFNTVIDYNKEYFLTSEIELL